MEGLKIIYEHGQPYAIRDYGGILFVFKTVSKFTGQDERYREELKELFKLADFLLESLKSYKPLAAPTKRKD